MEAGCGTYVPPASGSSPMQLGSADFDTYARNLKRIMWAEFIDEQMRATRTHHFRASLVDDPYRNQNPDLAQHFDYHRHRVTAGE